MRYSGLLTMLLIGFLLGIGVGSAIERYSTAAHSTGQVFSYTQDQMDRARVYQRQCLGNGGSPRITESSVGVQILCIGGR